MPCGVRPKDPFRAIAAWKDVTKKAGYRPAMIPTATASASVAATMPGWACNAMLLSTSLAVAGTWASSWHTANPTMHATTEVITHSATRTDLRERRDAPSTMRVLMPRMRVGLSASVKFKKLTVATMMTSRQMISSIRSMAKMPVSVLVIFEK